MGFKTGLLVVSILASGCAAPLILDDDNASVVTPLELGREGHIIVQATIDGQGPFRFALDTGASISVIFDTTQERAGLESANGDRVLIQGMAGAGAFPMLTISELRIGNESWTDARVALLPTDNAASGQLDGILGVDFLRRYAIGVSPRDEVVRLYPPQLVSERSYRGWTSISMQELRIGKGDASVYTIPLEISGIEIPAMLDLGTGSNLMNWHTARAIRVEPRKSEPGTEISGAVETVPVLAELKVEELKIEDLIWRDRTFLISDFPVFEALNLESRLVAVIGPNLFNERDFVIDFERQRMLIGGSR